MARAEGVLRNVAAMGLSPFLKPADVVMGNAKLNLGLVAQIFNANPGEWVSASTSQSEWIE